MKVGQETRRYFKGTPMGEQSACAKANGVGLDAELCLDEERALTHGDAARNLSLAYVDDAHVRIAYSTDPAHPWTRESAEQYADAVVACYPPPLRMITEPIGLPTYRFLETTTLVNATGDTTCVHFNRPWQRNSFNIQAYAGPLFERQQRSTEAGTMMRAIRGNTSVQLRPLLIFALAARCREMRRGAGHSRAFVRAVLSSLSTHPDYTAFFKQYGFAILALAGT